jgi:2-methylisocitrate lyase-like PEP mutase family enzyme
MAKRTAREKAELFKALHAAEGGFIMPNAWDAGSAVLLAEAGFKAVATTSAGIAFSLARPDYGVASPSLAVSRDAMFARCREIVDAVDIPVNGDLEAGYGDTPEAVAETIRLAIASGLAGGNIEDRDPRGNGLYDEKLAMERIAAARQAIGSHPFVLTARTDAFLTVAQGALKTSIRRANLYRKAGADCLYAPGPADAAIEALVHEIDGPINVVIGLGSAVGNAKTLLAQGVQRISLGGSIARTALAVVRDAARELLEQGSVSFAARQIPQAELNAVFARTRS